MAAGAIATVLIRLIGRHGITRGIKIAQKLGFGNKSIKQAFKAINKEQKKLGLKQFKRKPKRETYNTFEQRKYGRIMEADWKASLQDPDLRGSF